MEESLYQQAISASQPSPEAFQFEPPQDLIFTFGGKVPLIDANPNLPTPTSNGALILIFPVSKEVPQIL